MKRKQVSEGRKAVYYVGMGMSLLGLLLFLSTFVTFAMNFGNFNNFRGRAQSGMLRAFSGVVLLIAGGAVTTVGRAGLAGSGLVLDPEKAREDVEPWSRMSGGMLKDTLDEAGVDLSEVAGKLSGSEAAGSDLPFDEKLRRLHALREEGILTEEEYQREKQEILDRS
ncbi:hypothetical protein Mal64_19160 [Pseudobythopirellula maris]|uniref:SHOCT domain-containing protein n=1 Tax=Pseudobythopirellula maris TaxID=2527991 RepID=A0A5C5ZMZ4_9BACT|nr:SHOCT domain-containing protein [Pseudobythopirellula maris]TWT88435.1 hypothetical protein Mal64_19160 [Pseudobythopirellula maris]